MLHCLASLARPADGFLCLGPLIQGSSIGKYIQNTLQSKLTAAAMIERTASLVWRKTKRDTAKGAMKKSSRLKQFQNSTWPVKGEGGRKGKDEEEKGSL